MTTTLMRLILPWRSPTTSRTFFLRFAHDLILAQADCIGGHVASRTSDLQDGLWSIMHCCHGITQGLLDVFGDFVQPSGVAVP